MKARFPIPLLTVLILSIPAAFLLTSCDARQEPAAAAFGETAAYRDAALPTQERVADLLSLMTLQEKAAQTAQVARDYLNNPGDLRTYGIGSLLSGGGSVPRSNTPEGWADMIDSYQKRALESRLAIPILYAADAVHGHNNLVGATIFPHNIGLGAAGDEELVERIARATALETVATGVHWNFAPCAAVPRDERWGRTYEGFSEDTELTARLTAAAVRGYQGGGPGTPGFLLATVKHFVADGGTAGGVDQGDFTGSAAELREIHLPPYRAAIDAGAGSIMPSFSSWRGNKVHGSRELLTDLLRTEMGFSGLVVSDWAAVRQLPGDASDQILAAFEAGVDMFMLPDGHEQFIRQTVELVEDGRMAEAVLDRAVRRILTVKFDMGLFENPMADRSSTGTIGSPAHRELAREAVRRSAVLLKNDGEVLPLEDGIRIGVAGARADDLGSQCGGWTITWQGKTGDITEGTTVLEALMERLGADKVEYSESGDFNVPVDIVIAVVGETPYAEFEGDRESLALPDSDIQLIDRLAAGPAPLVTLLISGRPMIVTDELELSDAFLALWLPGTEGAGVADILAGTPPTGRLPHSWPASMDQVPVNDGDRQEPLFPLGYGLSW